MRYVSDHEGNKRLIASSIRDEDGNYTDLGLVESCYKTVDSLVESCRDIVTRKAVVQTALYNRYELAMFKAIAPAARYQEFLVALQIARVPVRDITEIKRIIEEEFKAILADVEADHTVDNEKRMTITRVKTVHTYNGGDGITVVIELL